eukprot:1249778-Pleurochrysis_carterae.AAC.1
MAPYGLSLSCEARINRVVYRLQHRRSSSLYRYFCCSVLYPPVNSSEACRQCFEGPSRVGD